MTEIKDLLLDNVKDISAQIKDAKPHEKAQLAVAMLDVMRTIELWSNVK